MLIYMKLMSLQIQLPIRERFAMFNMDLINKLVVDDIPTDEDDDISAIVSRYLHFTDNIGLDATTSLNGLQEIFLKS